MDTIPELEDFSWPISTWQFIKLLEAIVEEKGKVSYQFFARAIAHALDDGELTAKVTSLAPVTGSAHSTPQQKPRGGSEQGSDSRSQTPGSQTVLHYAEQLGARCRGYCGKDSSAPPEAGEKAYIILGPTHGHASTLAHVVLTELKRLLSVDELSDTQTPLSDSISSKIHFVFLGDYVDGGLDGMSTVSIVALLIASKAATALVGRHELLFPVNMMVTGNSGRFDEELRISFLHLIASDRRKEQSKEEGKPNTLEEDQLVEQEAQYWVQYPEMYVKQFHSIPASFSVRSFFLSLPLACTIDGKYFCVCGGLTPKLNSIEAFFPKPPRSVSAGTSASSTPGCHFPSISACGVEVEQAIQSVLSDPMDDDDEYQEGHNWLFRTSQERPEGFIYSFDAACNFLHDAGMLCIFRANCYVTNRSIPGTNNCGRPWHYQHSPFDPGYRMYRKMPTTALPSVISLFSAPHYCSVNQNRGAYVHIPSRNRTVPAGSTTEQDSLPPKHFNLRQFVGPSKQGQPWGMSVNAFRWSLPTVTSWVHSAVHTMLFDDIPDQNKPYVKDPLLSSKAPADIHHHKDGILSEKDAKLKRFKRMCLLMRQREVPLAETLKGSAGGGGADKQGQATDNDGISNQQRSSRQPLRAVSVGANSTLSSLNVSEIEGLADTSGASELLEDDDVSFVTSTYDGAGLTAAASSDAGSSVS